MSPHGQWRLEWERWVQDSKGHPFTGEHAPSFSPLMYSGSDRWPGSKLAFNRQLVYRMIALDSAGQLIEAMIATVEPY